ncbi:hypothetical protein ACTL32_08725 [Planococcus sp. FY231025]|uniref:hypothetical protein n=1 Tax=Planococcus sp. FY231025 TaxID=3455699 RepID=UPI003F8FCE2C
MIVKAEIISQPISGEYKEKIYDVPNTWNSQEWTWVKFFNDDSEAWYGNFRGTPKDAAVSANHNRVLVLTSDYLFELDRNTGNQLGYDNQTDYQTLTVAPNGDFIIADYNNLYLIKASFLERTPIFNPIDMHGIEFKGWTGHKLLVECEDLAAEKKLSWNWILKH